MRGGNNYGKSGFIFLFNFILFYSDHFFRQQFDRGQRRLSKRRGWCGGQADQRQPAKDVYFSSSFILYFMNETNLSFLSIFHNRTTTWRDRRRWRKRRGGHSGGGSKTGKATAWGSCKCQLTCLLILCTFFINSNVFLILFLSFVRRYRRRRRQGRWSRMTRWWGWTAE